MVTLQLKQRSTRLQEKRKGNWSRQKSNRNNSRASQEKTRFDRYHLRLRETDETMTFDFSLTYYEIDCSCCGETNLVRKTEYVDGDLIECCSCGVKFTEYD